MLNFWKLFFHSKKQQQEYISDYDVEKSFDGLDVEAAIQAHLDWKNKLEKAVEQHSIGDYDIEKVAEDCHCSLGKWIYNQAKQLYSHSKVYKTLLVSHANFHKIAAEILSDIQEENVDTAKLRIKRELARSSDAVQLDLIRLCIEVL